MPNERAAALMVAGVGWVARRNISYDVFSFLLLYNCAETADWASPEYTWEILQAAARLRTTILDPSFFIEIHENDLA